VGVAVGGTDVEVGASVGVKVRRGVGVALAGSVTGVALGVEEGAGKGVGEGTRTVLVGNREDVGVTSVQATSTKPTNKTASLDGFIDR